MNLSPIRKVYEGVAERRQMFRMFDRHAQRPHRGEGDDGALYGGEWFEIGQAEHDYMLEILPPLWMRGDMFAMREYLTGSITSIFFSLSIDGRVRYYRVGGNAPEGMHSSPAHGTGRDSLPIIRLLRLLHPIQSGLKASGVMSDMTVMAEYNPLSRSCCLQVGP